MALMTMSLMALGIFGFLRRGGVTRSFAHQPTEIGGDGVSYGRMPVSIWYIVTPSE